MNSVQGVHVAGENPYHDRLEGGTLTYIAAGKVGEQTLSGSNSRLIGQKTLNFPIHGFVLTASRRDRAVGPKRWRYLGLLEYLRHYPDTHSTRAERSARFGSSSSRFMKSSSWCPLPWTPLFRVNCSPPRDFAEPGIPTTTKSSVGLIGTLTMSRKSSRFAGGCWRWSRGNSNCLSGTC